MCHPSDKKQRDSMVGHVLSDSGHGPPRRRPLSEDEFMDEVRFAANRFMIAGSLLLTLIQLQNNGYKPSLNRAAPLVAANLPRWEQPDYTRWSPTSHVTHRPHSRRKMLDAFRRYRSVAHLVAAMIHGQQNDRPDIWPATRESLLILLAYSDCILAMGCKLPSPGRDRRFALDRTTAWRFMIPQSLVKKTPYLHALPLVDFQIQALNTPKRHKTLK